MSKASICNSVILSASIFLMACSEQKVLESQVDEKIESSTEVDKPLTLNDTINVEPFDCAKELLPSIHILGRGTDFPNFLIEDVSTELVRQDYESELKSIRCTGEPTVAARFEEVDTENGEKSKALEMINVTFPLDMIVFTGETNWLMKVQLGYLVEGLVTAETPSVKKQFKVLETYGNDGKLITSHIQVIRKNTQESDEKNNEVDN